jgi:hypothetical protein
MSETKAVRGYDSHDEFGNPLTPVYRHETIGFFDKDERGALKDAFALVAKYLDDAPYGSPDGGERASFAFELDGGTYTVTFEPKP